MSAANSRGCSSGGEWPDGRVPGGSEQSLGGGFKHRRGTARHGAGGGVNDTLIGIGTEPMADGIAQFGPVIAGFVHAAARFKRKRRGAWAHGCDENLRG